ncbi:membrane dipeptidase-domain-containing protein [Amylocystis lapponica]|nr:membrane dipeptidase-domain-containing protein [Amylocystis lapponica]
MSANDEQAPLLGSPEGRNLARDSDYPSAAAQHAAKRRAISIRAVTYVALTVLFVVALISMLFFWEKVGDYVGDLPKDPDRAALRVLEAAPVIDGHIDLPILARALYGNNISKIDLTQHMPAHVDIPRLRQGKVGGFFWSAYVDCPSDAGEDYLNATWRVRDTLEQIDVAKLLIENYPSTFRLALTSDDAKNAISEGKIASFIGIEGGHQIGNSLAVLRQYYELGVRYMTLTHSCHNAFADSCGILTPIEPRWGGLSPLGFSLITEMNRLGMLVDLSHTSDDTAKQALKHTQSPVIWSHSSARAVHDVPRNVPDDVLELVGRSPGKTDAVIMVNFADIFVANPGEATLQVVADHIDHIGNVAGRAHVGIGSDFDGIDGVPVGLEDVSKYPDLIAEMYRRGWNRFELAGLTGRNVLRILEGAEKAAAHLRAGGLTASMAVYDKRSDLGRTDDL